MIDDSDIVRFLSHEDIVRAVEDGFRQLGIGLGDTLPRREIRIRGKELPHAHPDMTVVGQGIASLGEPAVLVLNQVFQFPSENPPLRFVQFLIDSTSGDTLSIVHSSHLGSLRTGAGGAVGAKYLSKQKSNIVAILGSGKQARIQLEFLTKIRPIEKAYVFSRSKSKAERFCSEMEEKFGLKCTACESAMDAIATADILVTTTPTFVPIVSAEMLHPGLHVNIIGADEERKIELTGEALQKSDKIVIAGKECCEIGQIKLPLEQGLITRSKIYGEIGEIISGKKIGRESDEEITIFHSPGISIQDAAVANLAYVKARQLGLGVTIPDPFKN